MHAASMVFRWSYDQTQHVRRHLHCLLGTPLNAFQKVVRKCFEAWNRGRKRWFLSSNSSALALTDVSQRTVGICGHASIISVRLAVREEGINLQTFTEHLAQGATWEHVKTHLKVLLVCRLGRMMYVHTKVAVSPVCSLTRWSHVTMCVRAKTPLVRSGRSFCLQGRETWIFPRWVVSPWKQSIQLQTFGKL